MKKTKVYLAGSLFNEAEVNQRLKEGQLLREHFGDNLEIFNPIEQPFNEDKSKLPTPLEIFKGDMKAVLSAEVFLADLTNEDPGVMVELGIAWSAQKKIIAVNSDIRLKAANQYDIPSYGMNHFVLGCIESTKDSLNPGKLVYSFEEAMSELEEYLNSKQ